MNINLPYGIDLPYGYTFGGCQRWGGCCGRCSPGYHTTTTLDPKAVERLKDLIAQGAGKKSDTPSRGLVGPEPKL